MFTLLTFPTQEDTEEGAATGLRVFPKFEQLRARVNQNREELTDFYKRSGRYVKNTHVLVRFIFGLGLNYNLDYPTFRQQAVDNYGSIAHQLGFYTSEQVGRPLPSWSLGGLATELTIVYAGEFDPILYFKQSRTAEKPALSFIRHPKSELVARVPDGRWETTAEDVVVTLLDLTALTDQLYRWVKAKQLQTVDTETIHQFIYQQLLVDSISSLIDVAWFNRLHFANSGLSQTFEGWRTPIAVPDSSTYLQDSVDQILEFLHSRKLQYAQIAETVPCFNTPNLLTLYTTPDLLLTKQVKGVYAMGILPVLHFLTTLDAEVIGDPNTAMKSQLRRLRQRLLNDRVFETLKDPLQGVAVQALKDSLVDID